MQPFSEQDSLTSFARATGPFTTDQLQALASQLAAGTRVSGQQLAEIEQIARKLRGQDRPVLRELEQHSTDASRWFRAARHEQAGRHAEAAAILDGIWNGYWGEDRAQRLLACARNLVQSSQLEPAAKILADAAKSSYSYRTLSTVDRLMSRLRSKGALPVRRRCRIALLGSVTLDFWLPALRAQCFASGIDAEFHIGPFDQYQQEILNPESQTSAFRPDIVVLAVDSRGLGFTEELEDPQAAVERTVNDFSALWKIIRERLGAFTIHLNAEIPAHPPFGRLSAVLAGGRGRVLRQLNLALWDAEQAESGVAILDLEQTAAKFGKDRWPDPVLWHTAKQHPSTAAIPALTHVLTATIRAVLGLSTKCVAVDLDGVMWAGVIGEDGLAGISVGGGPVGEAHAAFQHYLKGLALRGILLAACSKNNLEDALLPFREHREMILKEEDFAVFLANWESKDRNLREIAKRINIGLDAIVFVDDNPVERAIVRQNIPEIEVIELPADPSLYVAALDQPLLFEAVTLTAEDRARSKSIRQNQERVQLEQSIGSVDDYLASLQMEVELTPFQDADLPRIVQLINKTNQFHLTTRRMNEAEVRLARSLPGALTLAMRVSDRFGDSGLTGVLIASRRQDTLQIDNWLMSCRVMGRALERVMMAAVIHHARRSGADRIVGQYLPTAKNKVVEGLYPELGFQTTGEPGWFERQAGAEFAEPSFLKVIDQTGFESSYVSKT